MKANRQQEILQIIEQQDIETQEELLHALEQRGFHATQATISRDIKQMNLVKEMGSHGVYRYVVSERRVMRNYSERLRTIFKEGITSFDLAQNIIVVKTMPGLAPAACAAIDGMEIDGIVSSLAGDDTAILIMRTNEAALAFCGDIRQMLT
ncbi:MAG: arginine repressor [Oscillospiraceae bacterium]|nr:arginine repressor [Oscillospiraceae bacterium]